ncbi:MAG: hypothetical protein J6Z11_08335 [Candidatus Riflebacteria bacterium]|nr:hypothetical protein [Candidatus Riflebacteria bacterium]
MRERDFDKGYKSGFQFGKEVANVEWLNKIKQAREEIEQAYQVFDRYDPYPLCEYSSRVDEILNKLITESGE